jgi:glycosyltransferase involved in cell wall biosynthesis
LKEKKLPSNLIMIGKVYSEVYYEEVIREIGKFNLETEITVLPMADHDDLAKLYQEADICFFSSYQRFGLSRVPIESMACGCLVISYGNEGSNEVIQNGKTGYIIPEGNIGAAANIIQTTVENPTTYRHIIQNARDEIEQRHSLEAYINQIEAYLYSVINENN